MPQINSFLTDFANRCFATLCELAPWLLLGMLISGVLHVWLPKNFIKRRFQGFGGVVKSVLLGVPLPLCSCGVIPAGIGLKNDGASDGAAVGFLISTPQTGIDSILVSASFFGWPFAIFKMLAAAITGLIGGWLTEVTTTAETDHGPADTQADQPDTKSELNLPPWYRRMWSHALEILESIWLWLVIGILVSALIGSLGVGQWVDSIGENNLLLSMLLMLAIATPLYVCATASVPIAASLVASGLSPAVALVFLMAGPATNLTTMGAIRKRFGWRVLAIYLGTLIVGSFLAAYLFDEIISESSIGFAGAHSHNHQNWWSILSAGVLLLLIGQILAKRWFRSSHTVGDDAIELSINGLHCQSCVSRIETAVGQLEEVDSVRVDLNQNTASINGRASIDLLRSVIEGLGFEVTNSKELS